MRIPLAAVAALLLALSPRTIQGPATTQLDASDVSWQFFMSL